MSHISFYRKYRSDTFDDLIGQEHVVQTLQNAIKTERLSHAYIFSGPRGTGKTSTARILAKTLNCTPGKSFQDCERCQRITAGVSVDVIEIDAASNTGVDNIRDLNEQVNFVPVECIYKVYIIDEVHMLSIGAFNALLKTLEEPPQNTVFVLATTEPHKIPLTIHSRCQTLFFRRLSHAEIVGHLKEVADKESIEISSGALSMIAQNSEGCMRDALSLLDQVYSFKGTTIAQVDVQSLLGAMDVELLNQIVVAFLNSDSTQLITLLKGAVDSGVNPTQLCEDLVRSFQSLVYVKSGMSTDLDCDETERQRLTDLSQGVPFARLLQLLEGVAKLQMDLRWFPQPEILLQVKSVALAVQEDQSPAPTAPTTTQSTAQSPAPTAQSTVQSTAQSPAPQLSKATVTAASNAPTTPTASEPPKPNPVPPAPERPPAPPEPISPPSTASVPAPAPPQAAVSSPASSIPPSGNLSQEWSKLLSTIESKKRTLYTLLIGSSLHGDATHRLTIVLDQDYQFFLEKLKEEKTKSYLDAVLKEAFPSFSNYSIVLKKDFQQSASPNVSEKETLSSEAVLSATTASDKSREPISKTINQIVDLFEGELVQSPTVS